MTARKTQNQDLRQEINDFYQKMKRTRVSFIVKETSPRCPHPTFQLFKCIRRSHIEWERWERCQHKGPMSECVVVLLATPMTRSGRGHTNETLRQNLNGQWAF